LKTISKGRPPPLMTSIKAAADLLIWIASTPPLLPKPGVKWPRDVVPSDGLGLLLAAEGGGSGVAGEEGDLDALPHLELPAASAPRATTASVAASTPGTSAGAAAPDSAGGMVGVQGG
jgi:hypothetical protein